MMASEAEDVQTVEYTPGGKVSKVVFTSTGDSVRYFYNDRGYKCKTRFTDISAAKNTFQWYVSDAAGTVMAIYEKDEAVGGDTIKVTDQPVYADGRVAVMDRTDNDAINFEISDHQGNVRVTFKEVADTTQITSWTDYYPFGSPMPGRSENLNTYRFNYQGQENAVSQQWKNFELRMYNSDLARFNSPDPYGQFHSPYVGMGNSPVNGSDPSGGYMAFGVDNVGGYAESVRQRMEWREFVRFKDFMYQNGGGFYNPVTGLMDYKGQSAEQLYHLGMRAPNDWGRSEGGYGYNPSLSWSQMAEREIGQLSYTQYSHDWVMARGEILAKYRGGESHKDEYSTGDGGFRARLPDEVVDNMDWGAIAFHIEHNARVNQVLGASREARYQLHRSRGIDRMIARRSRPGFGARILAGYLDIPVKKINGVNYYEIGTVTDRGGNEYGRGITLPGIGIFVSEFGDLDLVNHEYGHWLQYKDVGLLNFYTDYGLPSLFNAIETSVFSARADKNRQWHANYWTEVDANIRAYNNGYRFTDRDYMTGPTFSSRYGWIYPYR